MTKRMELAVAALQEAVDEEMERKAKLGYKAVIADKNGNPLVVSAKTLVRKRRLEKRNCSKKPSGKSTSK